MMAQASNTAQVIDERIDRQSKIDLSKAVEMRLVNGLSYQDIGDYFGVTKQAVQQRIQAFTGNVLDPQVQKTMEKNRGKIYGGIADTLALDLLDPKKRESASLNNVAYAMKAVYDTSRIASGLSTSNVSIANAALALAEGLGGLEKDLASLPDLDEGE